MIMFMAMFVVLFFPVNLGMYVCIQYDVCVCVCVCACLYLRHQTGWERTRGKADPRSYLCGTEIHSYCNSDRNRNFFAQQQADRIAAWLTVQRRGACLLIWMGTLLTYPLNIFRD